MFLKKRHLEILKEVGNTNIQKDIENKLPEEYNLRVLELYILGFVSLDNDKITLTPQGEKLLKIIENIDMSNIPEIFLDSEIVKIMELLNETNYVPENWLNLLKERNLTNENNQLNDIGVNLLNIYYETHPIVYLTPDLLSFVVNMPKIGLYKDLVTYKSTKNAGDHIVNALQAMRLLLISPPDENGNKAFTTTNSLDYVLKINSLVPNLGKALILTEEDFNILNSGNSSEQLENQEYCKDGNITELGQNMVNLYKNLNENINQLLPIYILEDEIAVLKTIDLIKEKYETNPEIIPTYNEIKRRSNIEDLGEILHILESKELIKRDIIKNKEVYWNTDFGNKVKELGSATTDGTKVVVYSKSNNVPMASWVIKSKNENIISKGITEKGKYLLKLSKSIKRKPYLTKYDIATLINIPVKRYIHKDELVELVKKQLNETNSDKEIIKSLGEAESKGFIVELQNQMIKLSDLGTTIKQAAELSKVSELLSVKFAITPTTFDILKTIYDNKKEFDKIWKEKLEGKEHKVNEIMLLAKYLHLTPDEIKKNLVILRNTGLLGKKGLTESGNKIINGYLTLWNN